MAFGVALLASASLTQAGEGSATGRQWHTLSIDGARVGYAYREQRKEAGKLVDSRVVHIEVTQLRHRSPIETRTEIVQGEPGAPLLIRTESSVGIVRRSSRTSATAMPAWPDEQMRTFVGERLVWEPCAQDCDARVEQPFDPMARLVVQSPYRVPHSAFAGPIRYVISRPDGGMPRLPATSEQAVSWDGAHAVVTICGSCGEADVLSESDRQRYLAPNAWVQSDRPEISAFARRSSAGATKPERIMTQLVKGIREYMNGPVDYLGYSTSLEALRSRGGDCTEFSVLLAAAARARGVPARIVAGLVYSDRFSGKKDVFSPHMWVQAWTGTRWTSYDAGIGEFDATHLALAIGDGSPQSMDAVAHPAREYRIEKLGLVRPN